MRGWNAGINHCLANVNDHILIACFIGVEMYGDAGVLFDVPDFVRLRLAEDQKRIVIPDEPDRPGLRY